MQHDITKLCADSLRAHLNTEHGIKLKSGHAHEIVAAFFGYKSRIAMLADKKHPIDNLAGAEFILLDPPTLFVDQRLKDLEGLSPDFPPGYLLVEGVYSVITGDKELLEKIQPSFHDLALFLAEERLHQQLKSLGMAPKAIDWITDVTMQISKAEVLMTVSFDYRADEGKRLRYMKVNIKLPRVAANIGYGMPEVIPTFYSGQFSDPDFNPDFGTESRA